MPRVYEKLNVESDFGGRFPWKSQRIAVGDGVRQAVIGEGPRTAPVTFVLLHGNPTWGFLYRKFITALASDYRVIVPDHVGFGRSDKPFKLLVLGKGGWKRATRNNFFTEMFLIRGSRLDEATAAAYRAAHPTPDDRIGIARFPQLIPETANLAHESRRTMAAIESALPSIADRPVIFRKKTRRTRSCHGCERGRMRGFAPARCTRRVNAALLRPPRRLRLRSRR